MPVEQAHLLHAALSNAGARVKKIILRNAGHGFEPVGGKVIPSMTSLVSRVLLFLAWNLRK